MAIFDKKYISRNIVFNITTQLLNVGKELIDRAYKEAAWSRITGNLDGGFAAVVFYKGKISYDTNHRRAIRYTEGWDEDLSNHAGWKDIPDGTAHEWFDFWLDRYQPREENGFELVIINVAYYSKFLEGEGKYRVITYLINELENRGGKFAEQVDVQVI